MQTQDSKISALIITYNEINHIKDLIANVTIADEIIVVDSFSNDGTFEFLKTLEHVKVVQRAFENFANQRNYSISLASHPWILVVDADERLTPQLKQEIAKTLKNPSDIVAYKFPRKIVVDNKIIRYSGLQTDKVYRLFKKEFAYYDEEKIVHETLIIDGKSGNLVSDLLHYTFSSYEHYKTKTEHYATLKAQELFKKGKKPTFWHYYFRPTYKFMTNYIFRLGFLDGKEGYTICKLNAHGVAFRYKILEELFRSAPKQ